ncbi:cyclic nucleotide-binding domain-containing protein [Yoonia sp. GPGPB17]|uniref:cyclic nucleotide-binding domain-containing protein n=1 Tax=Yoonia sp. GPGPB17 TaxID=3026147 RepID=UPI0030C2B0E1
MFSQFLSPSVLIILAGGVQILGYLFINQTYLRLTMLCSTSLYILYYFHVADTPLWGAIVISTMTLVAILIGLAALYARNASWSVPEQHKDIYPLFDELMPGDFRKVMRLASRETLTADRIVTREGENPDVLIFVTKGTFHVQKGRTRFNVPGPTFIGEVAYLRGTPSAATTVLPVGTEVVIWPRATLARHTRTAPRLKLALDALISRDLANKVSFAVSPDAEHH